MSCGERQRKDIDLPFLLHVLDSTGFGESEEISSWGKGELENKMRVREQIRMDICGWVSLFFFFLCFLFLRQGFFPVALVLEFTL